MQEDKMKPEPVETIVSRAASTIDSLESATKPYSIFSTGQKKLIVLSVALTAFISTVSAQIYLPAMSPMARDLDVSDESITLTITTYMIFQALAPTFITSLADTGGRRPAYLFCFVIYIASSVGLALVPNFTGALVLRSFQSIGSSSTTVLCNAVIADIITSAERGQYFAYTLIPQALAPSIGPLLGGVLAQYLGWRSVFWFLTIYASVMSIIILSSYPETCRELVGDGSILPPKPYWTLRQYLKHRSKGNKTPATNQTDKTITEKHTSLGRRCCRQVFAVFHLFFKKQPAMLLWSNGLSYLSFYCVPAAMPFLLRDTYGFSETQVGLMFLPLAGGVLLIALLSGKVFSWNYKRHCQRLDIPFERSKQFDSYRFPIERARLEVGLPLVLVAGVCTMGWGWAMHLSSHIAVIAILNFLVGAGMAGSNSCINMVLIDTNPGKSGTAMAASNISKCLIGAGATAAILPLINAIGAGPAFAIVGCAYLLCFIPLLVIALKGLKWRQAELEGEEQT
ncbi:hypothetical protein NLG97_g6650 [Lecanicillium saksenae]|uniref:Uncharacterized protein n=1 Tax=Lecanicillium saksenae TaxID=468837 RepID=A0ACC1QP18_9HYPO|nr:hypothetical protein NLG97_g6650 [Lecanicillium saksenae]